MTNALEYLTATAARTGKSSIEAGLPAAPKKPKANPDALFSRLDAIQNDVEGLEASTPGSVAVSVLEAAKLLGCGRTEVFELLKTKKLKRAKKTGRKTMVTRASVEAFQKKR